MRTAYVSGDAWCIAHGDLLAVLDRGLDAATATAIHVAMTPAGVRDEPLALAVLEPVDEGWLLWRRRGVPAVADVPLPDRSGEAWGSDLLPRDATVAFGAVGALAEAMPLEGGVVRASAVRVELVAREADPASVVAAVASASDTAAVVDAPVAPAVDVAPRPEPVAVPQGDADAGEAVPVDAVPGDAVPVDAVPVDPPVEVRDGSLDSESESESEPAPDSKPDPAAEATASPTSPDDAASAPPSPSIAGIIDSVPGYIRPAAVVEVPDDLAMGDHDGMTVASDAVRALAAAAREQREPPILGPATGPVVLSTLCAAGHVNPPGAAACGCGAAIASSSADQRARPEFAELVLPDGERVPLGRGVVLGRRPRSRRVEDGRVPRLVTVHSPSEDISRSHLEVRCEDWNVLAIDLESTNGTVLLRDGAAPMRLRADSPQLVAFGDRLDLGDGVVVRVERVRREEAS